MSLVLPMFTLWLREIVRFLRQPNRVFGALGQPILFWLFIGAGFGASFRPMMSNANVNYMEYFFPGIIMMILLFTAIFSTFSVIEDRNEGFLQGVLVSPAPRLSIVLGKVLGGATIALVQAVLFLVIAPFIGFSFQLTSLVGLLVVFIVVAMSLTSFGLCLAWRMDSIQGFHALMMLILLPMWFLSGAFFPVDGLPGVLKFLMMINPVTYGLALIRRLLYWDSQEMLATLPSLEFSLFVVLVFGLVTLLISWRMVAKTGQAR